jgi:hypothetical protein
VGLTKGTLPYGLQKFLHGFLNIIISVLNPKQAMKRAGENIKVHAPKGKSIGTQNALVQKNCFFLDDYNAMSKPPNLLRL